VFLRVWITILIIGVQFFSQLKNYLFKTWGLLLISLIFVFFCSDMVSIYFFFEVSLIPIFLIVIGWGYQPERLIASLFLFFYTLFASLPLIVFILYVSSDAGTHFQGLFLQPTFKVEGLIFIWGVLAFLVKFPVFGFHLWLPKAHVEAPVSGSIILAGVLLKLGGYGLLRIRMYFSSSERFNLIIIVILGGGGILRVFCIGASDIKIIIAYSSVVHIALIAIAFKWRYSIGLAGGVMIILSHGVCRSGLFGLANILYERSHSRSFLFNKGNVRNYPFIISIFFILIIANFGGPFTLNLLGEVLLIIGLGCLNQGLMLSILLLSFFSAAYRLILFRRVAQGRGITLLRRYERFSSRELGFTLAHCWPLVFICAAPSLC